MQPPYPLKTEKKTSRDCLQMQRNSTEKSRSRQLPNIEQKCQKTEKKKLLYQSELYRVIQITMDL